MEKSSELFNNIVFSTKDLGWNLLIFRVPVVLVGNKTDLHMERMISYEEGKKLAEDWNAIFLETSAKQTAVSNLVVFKKKLIFGIF